MRTKLLLLLLLSSITACGGTTVQRMPVSIAPAGETEAAHAAEALGVHEAIPEGRLPRDIAPTRYELALTIVPTEQGFSGHTRIHVMMTEARSVIWLHGRDLNVSAASVTPAGGEPIEASYEQVDEQGVAKLTLAQPINPCEAVIDLEYTANYNHELTGLYRVDEEGESYGFTQFEATSARRAFPSFDEPSFKVPFDVTITAKADHVVAANTPVQDEQELPEGMKRTRFQTTRPLPTYLIAWAVGPLDVVEHAPIPANDVRSRPLPLRGIAVKGRGPRLAYALEHTGEIIAAHEAYFGRPYPYAKLDIVAVPDFGAGAMENVGLVTFRETLLLLDDDSPEQQKRGYAGVMSHELAHMWFGDLVTMPWWNDIWLNEAFATWMGHKTVQAVYPQYQADLGLLDGAEWAMGQDSLTSARRIRQPIESSHDIHNAFDGITYQKGGGVLSMVERWLGEDTFQSGIRAYLNAHAYGNATADDLLAQLSETSGRDVATPFRSFLDQPGVPFVETSLSCEGEHPRVSFAQSRYLPLGSPGDANQSWQIPICVRHGRGDEADETCTLLTETQGTLDLEGECPEWIMPNAGGAGYFRFGLPTEQLQALTTSGWEQLTTPEKMALGDSLGAAFARGTLPAADLYALLPTFANDPARRVATMPMGVLSYALHRLVTDAQKARVKALGKRLYRTTMRRLGWAPRRGRTESGEDALMRAAVIRFMALTVEDAGVRRRADRLAQAYLGLGRRGDGQRHPEAVDANLVGTVLAVAVQDGDAAFFDALTERLFASDDALMRRQLLGALGSTKNEELAERARGLSLDARLRVNEVMTPLGAQISMPETREGTWRWLVDHYDAFVGRIGPYRAGYLPYFARSFCTEDAKQQVAAFFNQPVEHRGEDGETQRVPRIETLAGGPRNLAGSLEAIHLCATRVEAQRESAQAYFSR
ncbi:MAG: M1 family metallopeptidase [Deltaproteobacteria bacterium]|nr:M1 family metallopeptidase [Deltaproteobacteria bacterium]